MFKQLMLASYCLLLIACTTTQPQQPNIAAAHDNAQLGLAYLQQGKTEYAKNKLLLALHQAPNDPLILDAMGYFLEKTGESKTANQYYLQAIKIAPHEGAVHNNYGAYLCRHGHYQTAIEHFLQAVKDKNYLNTAAAYENAGLCALKIPDKKSAKLYFQQALNSNPTKTTAKAELAKLG